MSNVKVFSFPTADDVARSLDAYLAHASAQAIARTGRFTVAFSGGSLPATAAKYLKSNKAVDFSKWFVFWADERCVGYTDGDSNYKLVKEEFLDHVSIPSSQVVAINESLVGDSEAAAKDYEEQLQRVFGQEGVPVFDCILLGIGPDGHTCSLFPGHPQISETEKWVTHIDDSPKPPPRRITLTLPVLNNAREVAFVVTGGSKADMVKIIVDDKDLTKPSAHVAPATGSVYWFVDDATSKDLSVVKPSTFKL
ncbi:6-phosphogluconolactonase [Martensiomyces pterosporus]|nr:6-phosphogluconolactonase [Martensiomyces pterosporus]